MQQREPVRHDICYVELCITVYAEFRINGTEVRDAARLALRKHPIFQTIQKSTLRRRHSQDSSVALITQFRNC
jgi:hypothetical protein